MNPWENWLKEQTAKPENKLPARLRSMHSLYGIREDQKCGNCANFVRLTGYAGTYFKCELTKWTHGAKTDWRVNWTACGKFQERKEENE